MMVQKKTFIKNEFEFTKIIQKKEGKSSQHVAKNILLREFNSRAL